MKKLILICAVLLGYSLAEKAFAAEDQDFTIVIGNTREPGGVKSSNAVIVKQDSADFTHTRSFTGEVVSIDLFELRSDLKYPHVVVDFVSTPAEEILGKLGRQPTCAFFEWFPSCRSGDLDRLLEPNLLPALKNAFQIMRPGGAVIIDHYQYTLSLPDASSEAFAKLKSLDRVSQKYLSTAIRDFSRMHESGIISKFLQEADPFTLYTCQGEKQELRDCLFYRIKNNDKPFDDSQCTFIRGNDQDISNLLVRFSKALGMSKGELMIHICNGMLLASKGEQEDKQGYWDLFEQHYYMLTRGPLIVGALRKIGFEVEDSAIQYHEINPYNQRRHAWIIKVTKPT